MGLIRLKRNPYLGMRLRGYTGAVDNTYHYGYPAYGSLESDVTAQWLFDEASGDIIDEVAGIVCTKHGTPTYSRTLTGLFVNISPGVQTTASGDWFLNDSGQTALSPGTGNFTIEAWMVFPSTDIRISDVSWCYKTHGYLWTVRSNQTQGEVYIEATDGTAADCVFTIPGLFDDLPHKHRLVGSGRGTASAQLEWFIDGASQGAVGITGLNGKTLNADRILFGWDAAIGDAAHNQHFEYRFSKNATNNSGGPGGG